METEPFLHQYVAHDHIERRNAEFFQGHNTPLQEERQGLFVRKLHFGEALSPSPQFQEYSKECEFDLLLSHGNRGVSDSAGNGICHKRLSFGVEEEQQQNYYSPNDWKINVQHIDEPREYFAGKNPRNITTSMFCIDTNDTEIECEEEENGFNSKVHKFGLQRAASMNVDEAYMNMNRNSSQDYFQLDAPMGGDLVSNLNAMEYDSTPRKVLPTCKNHKTPDLFAIKPQILCELMNNYDQHYLIIDCRYDYEFYGGHIKGAIHIDVPDVIELLFIKNRHLLYNRDCVRYIRENFEEFFSNPHLFDQMNPDPDDACVPLIIFHCEFSQKRGPRGLRALRELDRIFNNYDTLNLFYPEVYILEGGYSVFHNQYPQYCTPENSYIRMIDDRYKDHYNKAREREKSFWKSKHDNEQNYHKLGGLRRSKTMLEC